MENKLLEIDLNETTEYDFDDFTQNAELNDNVYNNSS